MTIDATFSWASDGTRTRDVAKSMEIGWLIETKDKEYSTEKVNYKWYSSKQKWPRKEGEPAKTNAWRWDFTNSQEICHLGGEQQCWSSTSAKAVTNQLWTLNAGTESNRSIQIRATRPFKTS